MLTKLVDAVTEVIPFELFSKHLRLNDSVENGLLNVYLQAAIRVFESETPALIGEQTWQLTLTNWQQVIYLQKMPINSITSFKYYDVDDTLQDFTDYEVLATASPYTIFPKSYEALSYWKPDKIQIKFKAGYTTFDLVPKDVANGVLLLATMFNEERTELIDNTNIQIPFGFRSVINSYKNRCGYGDWNCNG